MDINATDTLIPVTPEMRVNEPCFRKGWTEYREPEPYMTPRQRIKRIARLRGITTDELYGTRGCGQACLVRQEAMTDLRDNTNLSYPAIGRLFNRHHTTVIHNIKAYRARRAGAA